MKQPILLLFLTAALTAGAQKLSWLDSFTQRSWRASDGFGDIQQITPGISDGKLNDFAVDPDGKHIYYAIAKDFGSGTAMIARTNLDGSGLQIIVPEGAAVKPQQLALDLQNQVVYWTSTAETFVATSSLTSLRCSISPAGQALLRVLFRRL